MRIWQRSIAIAVLFGLGACEPVPPLAQRLKAQLGKGAGTEFELAGTTDVPWEIAYVFGPYTTAAQVETALGLKCCTQEVEGLSGSKSGTLFVFVANGKVVYHSLVLLPHVLFDPPSSTTGIRFSASRLQVYASGANPQWLRVRPVARGAAA